MNLTQLETEQAYNAHTTTYFCVAWQITKFFAAVARFVLSTDGFYKNVFSFEARGIYFVAVNKSIYKHGFNVNMRLDAQPADNRACL